MKAKAKIGGVFTVEGFDVDGYLKWTEEFHNLIVNEGLYLALDNLFVLAVEEAAWFVGLIVTSPPVIIPANVMNAHAGWAEEDNYTEADRVPYTAVRTLAVVSNTAAKALFTADVGGFTATGAFLASDDAKNGVAGKLLAAGAFVGGDKTLLVGESLRVRYDLSLADDGI